MESRLSLLIILHHWTIRGSDENGSWLHQHGAVENGNAKQNGLKVTKASDSSSF